MSRTRYSFWLDNDGYCYSSQEECMRELQFLAFDLMPYCTRGIDRHAGAVFIIGSIIAVIAGALLHFPSFAFLLWLIAWSFYYNGRTKRIVRRVISQRLCFHCGYSLHGLSVSEQGLLTCPECGSKCHPAEYRCPPVNYIPSEKVEQIQIPSTDN